MAIRGRMNEKRCILEKTLQADRGIPASARAAVLCRYRKQYLVAQRQMEAKINAWYQRFANNNAISLVEARRLLNSSELDELKWDVEQYIRYGKENAINGQWMKELENASAKVHINRLEALKLQMQQSLEVMFGNQLDSVDSTIRDVYNSVFSILPMRFRRGLELDGVLHLRTIG